MYPRELTWGMVLALAVAAIACEEPIGPDGDGDVDADADADGAGDGDADQDGPVPDADLPDTDGDVTDAGPLEGEGPVTHVVESLYFVTDRLCDLDGDGFDDNAIADLGSSGPVLAMALNTISQGYVTEGGRLAVHMPWVEDRGRADDPDVQFILFEARDTDVPRDVADDFSGSEPFWVAPQSLDECGEPIFYFAPGALDEGRIFADRGMLPIPMTSAAVLVGRGAEMHGTVEPGLAKASVLSCAYVTIADLGDEYPPAEAGDLTLLEVLLAGGTAWGLPTVPGLTPDVDVDGDGFEQFITDEDGHIISCVDGDRTTMEGRQCWQNPRMADGVSFVVAFETVNAELEGRYPDWEDYFPSPCTDPPETSLFDPL